MQDIRNALHNLNDKLACELLILHWDTIDVNKSESQDDYSPKWSLFHLSCFKNCFRFLELLLTHPLLDLNSSENNSSTAIGFCVDKINIVKILLKHQLIEHDSYDLLILNICSDNSINSMKLVIAIENKFNPTIGIGLSLAERFSTSIYDLLVNFMENPIKTRFECQLELCPEITIADLFVLIIFHSDDFLKIGEGDEIWKRFFKIARRLPMELQMVLCHRTFRLRGTNVTTKEFELACKRLVAEIG